MKYLLLFLACCAINVIVGASKNHIGPKRLRKVCASDGNIYESKEAFLKQVCEGDMSLETRKWDFCHVTPPKKVKKVTKRSKKLGERPMCATDNKTYQTIRDFNEARCKDNELKVAFRGECSVCTKENLCPRKLKMLKKKEKREKRLKQGKKVKERRFKKPNLKKLGRGIVCGSNGWAYSDYCDFLVDKCKDLEKNQVLKLVKREKGKGCPRPKGMATITE